MEGFHQVAPKFYEEAAEMAIAAAWAWGQATTCEYAIQSVAVGDECASRWPAQRRGSSCRPPEFQPEQEARQWTIRLRHPKPLG